MGISLGLTKDEQAQSQQCKKVGDGHGTVDNIGNIPNEFDTGYFIREVRPYDDDKAPDPMLRKRNSGPKKEIRAL